MGFHQAFRSSNRDVSRDRVETRRAPPGVPSVGHELRGLAIFELRERYSADCRVALIADPSTELDDADIIDVDPVVVVAKRSNRTPDPKVVARCEPGCRMLVRHASRVMANKLGGA